MTRIAEGSIGIDVNDSAAIAKLRAVEGEFNRTMREINRQKAEAKIDADLHPLDRALQEAKRNLRELEGERATVTLRVEKRQLDLAIKEARLEIKRLDGQKATVEIDVQGDKDAIAAERAMAREEENLRKATERRNQAHRNAVSTVIKEKQEITGLQREYAKLTDEAEKLSKRRAFSQEAKVKLELDQRDIALKMLAVKEKLNLLGSHPPVHVKIDTDRSDVGRIRGVINSIKGTLGKGVDAIGNIGNIRIMGNSLRTVGAVIASLAPVVTSLGGSIVALTGSLAQGLAGAAVSTGGVLAGLALNFGGLLGALKPSITDFKLAEAATKGYTKAVMQYGAHSKQAETAQKKMNNTLKSVDPLAAAAARGLAKASGEWQRLTRPVRADFLGTVRQAFKSLDALMPTLARNTNQTARLVTNELNNIFKAMRTPQGIHIFDSLGSSANKFLAPALDGLRKFGAGIAHVAEAGARLEGSRMGNAINAWGQAFDKATQPGHRLDSVIQRISNRAANWVHLFGAAGRLLLTVLNGGAAAGDKLVVSLTKTLNKWNEFLHTGRGQRAMADFFDRARKNTQSLASAFAPLIAAFVHWSSLLAPAFTMFFRGAAWVANVVLQVEKLIGLTGSLGTFAATLGALWAVSKIGGFVAGMVRVVAALREIRGLRGALSFIGGGAFGAFRGVGTGVAAEMQAAGTTVAAEIAAAMERGGLAASAELTAAMGRGGAVAAAEESAGIAAATRAGGVTLGAESALAARGAAARGAAGGIGAGEAAVIGGAASSTERAAKAAESGAGRFSRLKTAVAGAAGGFSLLNPWVIGAGVALYATYKAVQALIGGQTKLVPGTHLVAGALKMWADRAAAVSHGLGTAARAGTSVTQSSLSVQQAQLTQSAAQKEVNRLQREGKTGTDEYKQAQLNLKQATFDLLTNQDNYNHILDVQKNKTTSNLKEAKKSMDQARLERDSLKAGTQARAAANGVLNTMIQKYKQARAAAEIFGLNAKREMAGLLPVVGKAAISLADLQRQMGGKQIAQNIALKFSAPQDVGRVAASANQALQAGIKSNRVVKIIADSSSARTAINALNRLTLRTKLMHVVAHTASAHDAVNRLVRMHLPTKVMRMIGHVADAVHKHGLVKSLPNIAKLMMMLGNNRDARNAFAQVLGLDQNQLQKIAQIIAQDNATAVINSVKDSLNSVPRAISSVISIITKHVGKQEGGLVSPQEKTVTSAVRSSQSGAKVNKPTFLTGEEYRPEFVIATNPAYRRSNIQYLKMAAAALGLDIQRSGDEDMVALPAFKKGGYTRGTPAKKRPTKQIGHGYPQAAGGYPDYDDWGPKKNWNYVTKGRTVKIGNELRNNRYIPPFPHDYVAGADVTDIANVVAGAQDAKNQWNALQHGSPDERHHYLTSGGGQRNTALGNYLGFLKGRMGSALAFEQEYSGLTTAIAALADAMTEADRAPDNKAYFPPSPMEYFGQSVPPKNQIRRSNMYTWDELRDFRRLALKTQVGHLKEAYRDITGQGRGLKLINGIVSDLSTAQRDFNENKYATKSAEIKYDDQQRLNPLLARYAAAQANDVPDDPTTPYVNENAESLKDNVAPARAIKDFWEELYLRLFDFKGNLRPGADPVRAQAVAQSYGAAVSDYNTLIDAINPLKGGAAQTTYNEQMGILSTARMDLFSSLGSNARPWMQQAQFTGKTQTAPIPGSTAAIPQPTTNNTTRNVYVTNNYKNVPDDPHLYSRRLSFELENIL